LRYKRNLAPQRVIDPRGLFDGFSLLHTCSQIRNEFKNFYYRNTDFYIHSKEAKHFVALLQATNAPSPRAVLFDVYRIHVDQPYANCFDYLPALGFRYLHPQCKVDVDALPRDDEVDTWNMFKDVQNPEWRKLIVSEGICAIITNHGVTMIVIQSNSIPTWMPDHGSSSSINDHSIDMEIMERLGLPFDNVYQFACGYRWNCWKQVRGLR
jgi:hypothetical protein